MDSVEYLGRLQLDCLMQLMGSLQQVSFRYLVYKY